MMPQASKVEPEWSPNEANMGPKWVQNGFKIDPWRPLGASWHPEGLLERSWRPLGTLLEGSKMEKSALERLLAAPRGIPREFSAILRAKRLPKRRPRGSKIESKRRLELQMAKLQKSYTVRRILMILEVPGAHFGGQNRYKMASNSIFGV